MISSLKSDGSESDSDDGDRIRDAELLSKGPASRSCRLKICELLHRTNFQASFFNFSTHPQTSTQNTHSLCC